MHIATEQARSRKQPAPVRGWAMMADAFGRCFATMSQAPGALLLASHDHAGVLGIGTPVR